MPRNSNGVYSLPAGSTVSVGDVVLPSQHNPALTDMANALTGSIARNGSSPMLADLDLGGFTLANLGPAGIDAEAVGFAQTVGTAVNRDARSKMGDVLSVRDYANLQAAIDALPASGGTVFVPNGYNETLSANLSITRPNTVLHFDGNSLLDLGTNKIVFAQTAHNSAIHARSYSGNRYGEVTAPFSSGLTAYGLRIKYSGLPSGSALHGAIEIGDTTNPIEGICLTGFCINTASAGQYARGILARRTTDFHFESITIRNGGAGNTGWDQCGITFDGNGTGDAYAGRGNIINPRITSGAIGIQTLGQVNHVLMSGGTMNCTATGSGTTIGIWRDGNGSGWVTHNTEIAAWDQCLKVEMNIRGDVHLLRTETDAPGVSFDAVMAPGTAKNRVTIIGGCGSDGTARFSDNTGRLTSNALTNSYELAGTKVTLPNEGAIWGISPGDFAPTRLMWYGPTPNLDIGSLDRPLTGGIAFRDVNGTFATLDINGSLRLNGAGDLRIGGIKVVGPQQPAIASPAATTAALKTAVDALIASMAAHGLNAT